MWANQLSYNYFDRIGYSNVTGQWNNLSNPLVQHADWFFYLTAVYYSGPALAFLLAII
jgi:hypothetical protein